MATDGTARRLPTPPRYWVEGEPGSEFPDGRVFPVPTAEPSQRSAKFAAVDDTAVVAAVPSAAVPETVLPPAVESAPPVAAPAGRRVWPPVAETAPMAEGSPSIPVVTAPVGAESGDELADVMDASKADRRPANLVVAAVWGLAFGVACIAAAVAATVTDLGQQAIAAANIPGLETRQATMALLGLGVVYLLPWWWAGITGGSRLMRFLVKVIVIASALGAAALFVATPTLPMAVVASSVMVWATIELLLLYGGARTRAYFSRYSAKQDSSVSD